MCKKHKEPYFLFYNILGFYPNNINYYEMALIHRSSAIKAETGNYINNERLEFLGDAVLSSVIADVLYHHYKDKNEGFLSSTRSKIVQRETLNHIAIEIGLDKIIVTSKKNNIQKDNIYGNAFEALLGAIYLDQGYGRCKEFIEKRIFSTYLNLEKIAKKEINFKSKIIEIAQKQKINVEFNSVDQIREHDHKLIFETEILMNELSVSSGIGLSKKESQQNASRGALKKLQTNKELLTKIIQNKKDSEPTYLEEIQ